jgi:hypothetical protein
MHKVVAMMQAGLPAVQAAVRGVEHLQQQQQHQQYHQQHHHQQQRHMLLL